MKDLTLWAKDFATLTDAVKAAGLWDDVSDTYISGSHSYALALFPALYRYIGGEAKHIEGSWGMFRVVTWGDDVDVILKHFDAAGIISDPLAEMPIEWCGGNEKLTRYDPAIKELKTITLAESVIAVKAEKYEVDALAEIVKPK